MLVETARRRWRLVIGVALGAAVLAYAGSFMVSPSYSSTTQVLVRAREARFLTSSGQDLSRQPGVLDSNLAKSLSQTTAGMVNSRALAERVVRELGLDQPRPEDVSLIGGIRNAFKELYRGASAFLRYGYYAKPSAFEGAVMDVNGRLQGTPLKDSYLIEIKASAEQPELAAAMADAAGVALLDMSRERFQSDATTYRDFLKVQVERARSEVVAAEQAVRGYKEEQHIADVAEQLKLTAASQDALRRDLRSTEVDLEAARARLRSLQIAIGSLTQTETTTSKLETGRSSTTTTNVGPNKVYQELLAAKLDVEAEVAALDAKREALAVALAGRTPSVTLLPQQEARLRELELQQSAATDAYKSVRSSYEAALLNSAQDAAEFTKLDKAAVPLYPDKPVRWLFALVGLLAGVVAGLGVAVAADRRRRQIIPAARLEPVAAISVAPPAAAVYSVPDEGLRQIPGARR
ncbi:MAG TPA: Wzz/FepE/Etk N-terminal domain-containing protein [Candidatus Limnocylindria bacterium]|nr:Wzz/FepE/Etk N-terminal domain-containing protein [Candidatus Limnocylindria bacterium]